MPSSDPVTIPYVLKLVATLNPQSILEIGPGNGRYGFLFRETLDFNYGRFANWTTLIDAIEIEPDYIRALHDYIYNHIYIGDWLDIDIPRKYDLVFMGDVLEHFAEGDWQLALRKANQYGKSVIVVSPNWEGSSSQGAWQGYQNETHLSELSPSKVGGKCVFANSKSFICVFGDKRLMNRDVLL